MSDWSGKRWRWAVSVVAAAVVTGGAFVPGRSTAARDTPPPAWTVDVGSVATNTPYAGPTTPSGRVVGGPVGSTPDGGTWWITPQGGQVHGPAARYSMGGPDGYTRDADGAGLAAVNAVVGGLWLNPSFPDPWQTLGFLAADPNQARDNTELTSLITRGQPSVRELLGPRFFQVLQRPEFDASGSALPSRAPSAPLKSPGVFGAKVLGVHVSTSTVGGTPTAQATVLWETVGDVGLTTRPVRTVPVVLSLVWQGDWKVADYTEDDESPVGFVLPGVPAAAALPGEGWRL